MSVLETVPWCAVTEAVLFWAEQHWAGWVLW